MRVRLRRTLAGVVLVVDANAASADTLMRVLRYFGYAARSAGSADAALDVLRHHPVRVVILDYELPDHDGVWLLERVREDPALADVRSIVLSATVGDDVMERALAAGAVRWLVKGTDRPEVLLEVVRQLYGPPPA